MNFSVKQIENDTEENRMLNELCVSPICEGYVEVGEEKFVLPIYFLENWKKVDKFEVRDDDVFIAGHPKTGTTWIHVMVDLIVRDFNIEETKNVQIIQRLLFLETPILFDENKLKSCYPAMSEALTAIEHLPGPRSFKTHLPWFLLPEPIRNGSKPAKVIHCVRNPKDTCVSYYHQARTTDGYSGNFEEFCKLFLAGKLRYGSYFTTIKSYWEKRTEPNVLNIKYSDMKKDLAGTIRSTAKFLGKTPTERQVNKMVEYLSFDSMKKHVGEPMKHVYENLTKAFNIPSAKNDLIRQGKEGGYKLVMNDELIEEFDKKTQEMLSGTGISF